MMGQLWMLLLFAVASMAISQTGTLSEKRGLTEISAVKHVGNRRLYNEKGKGKGGKGKGKGGNGKGKGGKGKGKDGKGKGKGGKGGKGSTDDDGSDVTTLGSFRCTERGTTDSPRYPWCPEDNEKNCAAIAQGLAAGGDETETYLVDFALEIDGDVTTTLARVEAFLQEHVATDLAGCGHYSFYTGKADIQSVTFEVVEDSESGKSKSEYVCYHTEDNLPECFIELNSAVL